MEAEWAKWCRSFCLLAEAKSLYILFTPFAVIFTLEPKAFHCVEAVVAAVLSCNSKSGKNTWTKSHFWHLYFPLIDLNTFLSRVRKYTGNKWMYLPVYIRWLFPALAEICQLEGWVWRGQSCQWAKPWRWTGKISLSCHFPSIGWYFTLQIETKHETQNQPTKPTELKPHFIIIILLLVIGDHVW